MAVNQSELTVERFIKASPASVWKAWSTPEHLEKWWIPAPMECRVIKLNLRAGGGFETQMRQGDEDFQPHVEGCFLEAVPESRLVWTTVLREGWRPIEPWLALTAIITFTPEGNGTRYRAHVLHRNTEDSLKHQEMGFFDGWGTVIEQLAKTVE
ncbi:SRPBCC family protein [Thalassospira xiamenensis]|uniref:SRPBCC family protein n=1 Tax=Thalassospira xiamenensis TaxID=220697 RepID=UPI00200005A8|nr:SRPBCC family protein [Thalassospira xiamenensis]MCK2165863.1 SRPBCC family protein [Thalassospira xiamenensis]